MGSAPPEPEEPLPADERAAVAARLERLERRRESLGAVNPLAAEEYETEGRARASSPSSAPTSSGRCVSCAA